MTPILQVANPNAIVEAATIERSQARNIWTYRLRIGDATADARAEVILTHRPGTAATIHEGAMKVAVTRLSNDASIGCADETDAVGLFKIAAVHTLRYGRNGNIINFSARHGHYCGHGDPSQADLAASIAALDANDELNPSVKIAGTVRGTSKGWRSGFSRFAGGYDRPTHSGNHLYAWQAGTGDTHARMFAVAGTFNTVSEERTGKVFYGYAADIAATNGALLGMICNWAGPGNVHTPNDRFQYQELSLGTASPAWSLVGSKIRYAPTNNCNSSGTMQYDVDANGALFAGEGSNVTNDLDSKGTSASVAAELASRGFTVPVYY